MRSRRRRSSAARRRGRSGDAARLADGVHDVLGVALQHGHERLHARRAARALGPSTSGRHAAWRTRVHHRAQVVRPGQLDSRAGSSVEASSSSRTMLREVRAQPRHAAELERVRHLVQRDPAQELLRRRPPARSPARARLGATNSSRAGAWGRAPGTRTGRARARRAGPRSRPPRPPAPARRRRRPGRAARPARRPACRRRGRARRAATLRFASIQPRAADRPRRRAAARGGEPRVRRDEPLALRRPERATRGERRRVGRRAAASGDHVGDLGGESPVDHDSMVAGGRRAAERDARELGAARAPSARRRPASAAPRRSGAPSGSRAGRERHRAARLAHDQLRGGDVDRAESRSVTIPSRRAPATWQSETAIAPMRAQAVGGVGQRVGRVADPARVGRLDRRAARACRRASAARADAGVQPRAVEPARPRRAARPTPPRARSRGRSRTRRRPSSCPSRDRDRERVVRQAALGVAASRRSGR